MAAKSVRGHCGLCQKEASLRDSHLLPASLYKLCREPAKKNPNPVMMTKRGATPTSFQVSAHFLCGDCEERFSRGGESHVVPQCARPEGFPLRNLLKSKQPFLTDPSWSIFEVSDTPTRIDQFMYFAASIFWRSSAKAWSFGGPPKRSIVLGQKYLEEFRRYLLGEQPFPEGARLVVHVWREEPVQPLLTDPVTFRVKGTYGHKFCIPGITFILFVGGNTANNFDQGALNSSTGAFMWLCPGKQDSLFASFEEMITRTIQKKRHSA